MSNSNSIIAHSISEDKLEYIKAFLSALKVKFEVSKTDDTVYSKEFVAKVNLSKKDFKNGDFVNVNSEDLDKLFD